MPGNRNYANGTGLILVETVHEEDRLFIKSVAPHFSHITAKSKDGKVNVFGCSVKTPYTRGAPFPFRAKLGKY